MSLTSAEAQHLLECMRRVHGPGYAPGDAGKLQAKLSIWVAAAATPGTLIPLPPEKQ